MTVLAELAEARAKSLALSNDKSLKGFQRTAHAHAYYAISAACRMAKKYETGPLAEIAAERRRQVSERGYDGNLDDRYEDGELTLAASIYARFSSVGSFAQARRFAEGGVAPAGWPWLAKYFRPTSPRRMLIKAGALIVAELERLDRAEVKS